MRRRRVITRPYVTEWGRLDWMTPVGRHVRSSNAADTKTGKICITRKQCPSASWPRRRRRSFSRYFLFLFLPASFAYRQLLSCSGTTGPSVFEKLSKSSHLYYSPKVCAQRWKVLRKTKSRERGITKCRPGMWTHRRPTGSGRRPSPARRSPAAILDGQEWCAVRRAWATPVPVKCLPSGWWRNTRKRAAAGVLKMIRPDNSNGALRPVPSVPSPAQGVNSFPPV